MEIEIHDHLVRKRTLDILGKLKFLDIQVVTEYRSPLVRPSDDLFLDQK